MIFRDLRNRHRHHAQYIFYAIIRRVAFLMIAFALNLKHSLQIMAMLYCNLIFIFYVGTKPLQTRTLNWFHYWEEMVVEACTIHLICFLWSYDDDPIFIGYGWSFVVIISLHFFIVLLWLLWQLIDALRTLYKKYSAIIKVWCANRKAKKPANQKPKKKKP